MATPEERKAWIAGLSKPLQETANAQDAAKAQRATEAQQLRNERAAVLKDQKESAARKAFRANGGTDADFDKAWDGLYADMVRQATLEDVRRGKPLLGVKL